jgi:hypothetical protein
LDVVNEEAGMRVDTPPPLSLRAATANPEPHQNPTRAHPALAARTPRAYPRSSDELIERELHASGAWVRDTFGERPDGVRAGEVWEHGVRLVARYRVEHDISGPGDALGPQPEQREEKREWERAHKAIARDQRRLGRDVSVELDVGLDIGF